ncbi:MAG: nucleotidyltransferase domain-containing protein, partial [Thermodesulfovibrionales bacterium]
MKNIARSLCDKASELISSGTDGVSLSLTITTVLDEFIRDIFEQTGRGKVEGISLVAIGGYGRREMAPFSDIDIMFLVKERSPRSEETAKEILYRLWDTGLTVGHSFRTLGDCVEEGMKEIQTRTALMESRFLAGDRMVFEEFRRDVFQRILYKNRKEFLGEVMRENDKRQAAYGGSVYLLQPNLKEGRGGLRDIHTISWLSRVSFMGVTPPGNPLRLMKAHEFLLLTRASLHLISGRRNDILSFELQEGVSRMLGLKDTRRFLSSEIMMRLLYRK